MSKKALIFSLAYYPHLVGGAEVAIKEITDRIPESDIEFDMVTLYAGSSRYEKIGNINVYRVGPKIKILGTSMPSISYTIKFQYVAMAFFKALLLHHKRKYDFIWSVMASFNSFSALFFKMIHKDIPFLLTLQEGDTFEHIKKALGPMYKLYLKIFQKADRIQVISHFLGNFGRKMGAKCPINIVPNGVDFSHFSKKPTSGQEKALLSELKLDPFDTLLITTSRLVPKNGIADLIDSLQYLPDEVKLIILGIGPLEKILKEKVRLLKIVDRVRFVGFVPHKEIPIYLQISDVFVRPSLSEGFGISFIEAMASDLPVIATPVGGIVDFIINEKTGLFCEVNNPKSISENVDRIMKEKDLRESMIKNAREMVKSQYDWNLIASEMKGIFDNL